VFLVVLAKAMEDVMNAPKALLTLAKTANLVPPVDAKRAA
jgi:hypothetical protein|tara:strand:+ start:503 stop:622 length:120 start_codon:yes stop_codon:yes gene_type:complete